MKLTYKQKPSRKTFDNMNTRDKSVWHKIEGEQRIGACVSRLFSLTNVKTHKAFNIEIIPWSIVVN